MKEKLITLIALLTLCLPGKTQVTVSLQRLNGTTWRLVYPEPDEEQVLLKFSNTAAETIMQFRKDDVLKFQRKYYLSDGIPSEFDFASVGKKNTGTYIIMYNDNTHRVMSYKVLRLSFDTLRLHYIPIPGTIIGSKEGQELLYRRVQ
ncbi:MAG: hypothetical protein NC124_16795 [Clostridium sp.]|nr:hypothetical protein [Bacteroidales bacterium]MCM1207260.1 hypothetical protein [Bacillota bacterium]MCM1500123.1 hypothetical protein [Clostridium sp.]